MRSFAAQYFPLLVPLSVWGLVTQAGQILPYIDCQRYSSWTTAACASAVIVASVAVISGLLIFRFAKAHERLVGYLCCAAGLLFTFALTLQGAASMLVNPCER